MNRGLKFLGIFKGLEISQPILHEENNGQLLLKNKIFVLNKSTKFENIKGDRGYGLNEIDYYLNLDFLNEVYGAIESMVVELNEESFPKLYELKQPIEFIDFKQKLLLIPDKKGKIKHLKKTLKNTNSHYLNDPLSNIKLDKFVFDRPAILPNLAELLYLKTTFRQRMIDYARSWDEKDYNPMRRLFFDFVGYEENSWLEWKKWIIRCLEKNDLFFYKYLTSSSLDFIKEFQFEVYDLIKIWTEFIRLKNFNDFVFEELEKLDSSKPKVLKNTSSKNLNGTTKTKHQLTEPKPSVDYDKIKLVDLFKSQEEYTDFEMMLKNKLIVDKQWNYINQEHSNKKLMCALVYILINEDYLVDITKKPEYYKGKSFIAKIVVAALNNTIHKVEIGTGNYSDHKKRSFDIYTDDSCLTFLDFLKKEN